MARGRKPKYTAKKLREMVEDYFDSISREVTVTEDVPTGRYDQNGHAILEAVPVRNRKGEEIRRIEYVIPPTVGGLCEFLGIHRSTWAEYCDQTLHPEFSDTTTRARGRVQTQREEMLLCNPKAVRGVIFDLQNNYGYSERATVELGSETRKAVAASGMTMEEKLALIATAKQAVQEDSAACFTAAISEAEQAMQEDGATEDG